MPKRTDIKSILIIGAGPIVIGQACEFDYSGAQACKALREEGYRVVLVNSNPATIMTDPEMADGTYIEPITWQVVEKIIAKERPDALLPTMGGQTALNCALDLQRNGVLDEVRRRADRRQRARRSTRPRTALKFKDAMTEIGLDSRALAASRTRWTRRCDGADDGIGFPMRHPARASRWAAPAAASPTTARSSRRSASAASSLSPTNELLIEESLIGWKEFEMEVVRDKADNCIIVCSIENLDPMGVHTGDSITVAPAQTLTDKEYQMHAQRLARGPARDRRRHRRLERAVRDQPEGRPHGRHRDEPARVALVGAGVQGHRLPDRQDRRQAGRRLHARRAAQRHHRRRDAGLASSRRSTTWSPRSRASRSRNSRRPTRA